MQQIYGEIKNFNNKYHEAWENTLMFLMCAAFILSDWLIGIFSYSDYLFGILFMFLILSQNYQIKKKQYKWLGITIGIIICNILLNYFGQESFSLKAGIAGLIKISGYSLVIVGFYNFIKEYHLETKFLKLMNVFAVIVCIIGFYISIALYTDGLLPYEFFWTFTRTDSISYLFEGTEKLYRFRSVFSEPSYLGYYLNILLSINFFNKWEIKINNYINLLLILTVFLTFSYSSIAILVIIVIFNFLRKSTLNKYSFNKKHYWYLVLVLIILIGIIFIAKETIQVTLIDRTLDILSGKDSSATSRMIKSWQYVDGNHLIRGNGIGSTPDIWNIYAYFLSDLGLIAFSGSVLFSGYIVSKNLRMGLVFILLNFQKGGYLAPPFYILVLLIFIYAFPRKTRN